MALHCVTITRGSLLCYKALHCFTMLSNLQQSILLCYKALYFVKRVSYVRESSPTCYKGVFHFVARLSTLLQDSLLFYRSGEHCNTMESLVTQPKVCNMVESPLSQGGNLLVTQWRALYNCKS